MKNLLDENKVNKVKNLLEKLIQLYKSNSKIVDHLYNEELSIDKYEHNLSLDNERNNDKENNNNKKVVKFIK